MSKKQKPRLRAALADALAQSYAGSGLTPVLAHVACYRGHLVAKVMAEGGCEGYYWVRPYAGAHPANTHQMSWASSFDEAFEDIDEMISDAEARKPFSYESLSEEQVWNLMAHKYGES